MMKTYVTAIAILLASAGAASSQGLIQCLDPTGMTCSAGSGSGSSLGTGSGSSLSGPGTPTTPGATTNAPGTLNGGTTSSQGTSLDQGVTSAIPQPAIPQGMPPLVIPNDPLGTSVGQSPFSSGNSIGGLQNNSFGNGGISSPGIQ